MQITDLVYIDSTGYHFADYPTFLAYYQQKYRDIYGADTYLEADSQDGQFVAVQAQDAYDLAALGASTYNSFSPVTSQGVGLSRVVKINGLRRGVPTNSTVDLLIVGQSGTTITNGVAIDALKQKWNLPASVLIPGGGSITVTATADTLGDLSAEPNTVNQIFTPTLGWQTVNNPSAASEGQPVESDAELRYRQSISTANPSSTVFEGSIGAVGNLVGVSKVRGYENDTDTTDGNGLPPHSVTHVVDGGDAMEIAQQIQIHKTQGTSTYGTTSEIVYDSRGMPLNIKFFRPVVATIWVRVTISTNQSWSASFAQMIKNAVAAAVNAGQIGDTVLITKLYAPAYLSGTPADGSFVIATLEIKKNAGSYVTTNIALAFNENPVCDPLVNVVVVIT